MVSGSAGCAGAAGCGAGAAACAAAAEARKAVPGAAAAASRPARKPANQARWTGVGGPTTRLRISISSGAKGAAVGIGQELMLLTPFVEAGRRLNRSLYRM